MKTLTVAPAADVPAMLGRTSRVFSPAAGAAIVGTGTTHALVPEHVAPVGQSLVALQRTHWCVEAKHDGSPAGQLVSFKHCTHVLVAVSQIAEGDAQSLLLKQPTISVAVMLAEVPETARTPAPKLACEANV